MVAGYLDRRIERRKLVGTSADSLEGLGVGKGNGLGGLGARSAVGGEVILSGRRGVGNIVEAELQAGDGADVNLGAVELDNLNLEAAGDGIGNLGRRAGSKKLRGIGSLVSGERTVDDTLSRLSHNDETTNELSRDVNVDLGRSLDLGDIELDVGKVTGGVGTSTLLNQATLLDITTAGRTAAIETVDGGFGRVGELAGRHVPVLESSVGVTETLDALNSVRGVEVTPGSVEGVERRAGSDAGALGSRVTGTTRVRASEGRLAGVHGLPVSPETVDVGVVQPEEGVEARELGGEELTGARSIPVNGVVNLLERSTVGTGGSELVEGGRSGHDIVDPLLVRSLAEEFVGT